MWKMPHTRLQSQLRAKPRDVFVCMYQILLGSASGPRLGPFMADIGAAKVAGRIRGALA